MPNTLLRLFRKYAQLDDVVKDAKNNLEKVVLLNDWAHHQIWKSRYGSPQINIYTPLYQLIAIQCGIIKGWCGNYAILLVNACLSMRLEARHVSIWKENSYGSNMHNIVEVWLPTRRKLVCLDPYYNLYFLDKNGRPLSVKEINEFVKVEDYDSISIQNPTFESYLNSSTFKTDYLSYYYGYEINKAIGSIENNDDKVDV